MIPDKWTTIIPQLDAECGLLGPEQKVPAVCADPLKTFLNRGHSPVVNSFNEFFAQYVEDVHHNLHSRKIDFPILQISTDTDSDTMRVTLKPHSLLISWFSC